MTMFRQSPPEYRALVVENEREFRGDLIYTIESMEIGISVVGEASDYDDARALIDSGEVDLLVTDINLTDEPRFQVGYQDGTELAQYARERYDIPCIFLTAFADYDPEVVTRAAATDPIGFIQKQGSEVGVQTEHLIRLALRRLELIRRERETTRQLQTIVDQLGKALVYIDMDGRILDFNTGAIELFQQSGDALIDQYWEDVIRVEGPAGSDNPLRSLIASAVSARLPALALELPNGESALISVRLAPTEHLREPCTLLVIQELREQTNTYGVVNVTPRTTLLAFGLEQESGTNEFDEAQLRIMMLSLQATLIEGIRTQDRVSRPMNTIVMVMLPDTDEATGYGIACTLRATVEGRLRERFPGITLRTGLAHRDASRSANATLAAALEALDRAQHSLETPVLSASTALSVQDVSLRSSRPSVDQSVLGYAFGITSKILDISTDTDVSAENLAELLTNSFSDFKDIRAFGICLIDEDKHGHRDWPVFRRRERTRFVDVETLASDLVLTQCLGNQPLHALPPLSFHRIDDTDISLIQLQRDERSIGLCVLESAADPGSELRPASEDEIQLARIAGEHLARVVYRALFVPSSDANDETSHAYNPYSLRNDHESVSTVSLLLKLDVPIAVVGESGMGRAKLLQHAALSSESQYATKLRIEPPDRWRRADQIGELRLLLRTVENTLLVVRDPQLMHSALQKELAQAIRNKTVTDSTGGEVTLPAFRFAATLPASPQLMAQNGELNSDLASALGAGVVRVQPLRESPGDLMIWAQRILDKEATRARRAVMRFDSAARASLKRHPWPGNLEELVDRIREAVARCPRDDISALDLSLFQLQPVSGEEARQIPAERSRQHGAHNTQQLVATLSEVVEICARISEPPVIGRWLEDEVVTQLLERYRADQDPVARSAEFLAITRATLRDHAGRAGYSSGERLSAAFWQSVRLAIRNWLDGVHGFDEPFENTLKEHVLTAIVAKSPPIGEERALRIAGCTADDYRAKVSEAPQRV